MTNERQNQLISIYAGIALEGYDWVLYALLVNYFAPTFFGGDVERSVVYGFGVFAVGFLVRPIGGVLFGSVADRHGRRTAMLLCIALAGFASFGTAATPSASAIGAAAPALVLLWRLLLGLAQGGELPVAQTYLYEISPRGKRNLFSSMVYMGGGMGKLIANLVAVVLVAGVGAHAVSAGYWRIPFLLGGLASVVFFVLRTRLTETAEFVTHSRDGSTLSPWRECRTLIQPMVSVIGLTAGVTAAYYVWTAAPISYGIGVLKLGDRSVLLVGVTSTMVFIVAVPLFGLLADRVGARKLLFYGAAAMAVATVPLQHLLERADIVTYWLVIVIGHVGLAAPCSVFPAMIASILPPPHRALGQALPYGITVATFGGTAPMLQHATDGHPAAFSAYIALLLAATAVTVVLLSTNRRGTPIDEQVSAACDSAKRK
ncbi:MFS transporter [Nocardia sp. NPDC004278]